VAAPIEAIATPVPTETVSSMNVRRLMLMRLMGQFS
jgi:hypothetical protein